MELSKAQKVGAILVSLVILVSGAWLVFGPSRFDVCKRDRCPPVVNLPAGFTLWMDGSQPRPGDVFRVYRNGDFGTVERISDYLADRAPLSEPSKAYDRTLAVNDIRGVNASSQMLSRLAPFAEASFQGAKSVILVTKGADYLALKSRSAFLTWLQDVVDRHRRETPDGDNLIAEINNRLPLTATDDPTTGGRYLVTEVYRASSVSFKTSSRYRERVGIECQTGDKDKCDIIQFGRNAGVINEQEITGATKPLAYLVQLSRIGSSPSGTLQYDRLHPGPPIVGR